MALKLGRSEARAQGAAEYTYPLALPHVGIVLCKLHPQAAAQAAPLPPADKGKDSRGECREAMSS